MNADGSWLQQLSEWVSLLQVLVWGLVLWGWWSLKRIFVRHEDCRNCRVELEEKQTALDKRQNEEAARHQAVSAQARLTVAQASGALARTPIRR